MTYYGHCLTSESRHKDSSKLGKAGTHKSAKTHARENPASSGKRTRGSDAGKILFVWWGITAGKTEHGLHMQQQWQYCILSDDLHRRSDPDLWPFDAKINEFPVIIMEHLYVKFGYPSCVGFWDIVWKNKQAAVKTVVGVGNQKRLRPVGTFACLESVFWILFSAVTLIGWETERTSNP